MNNVQLIGNLTRDPEIGETPSGTAYAKFTIAVSRQFAGADGNKEVDFINCIIWKGGAELVNRYLAKGSRVGVTGTIQTRRYTDKDGNNRTAFEIVVNSIEFLSQRQNVGSKNDNDDYGNRGSRKGQMEVYDDEDTLPF